MSAKRISRRTVLRGMGAGIALPLLHQMAPARALAGAAEAPPVRMAFLFVPNGIHMEDWRPKSTGADYVMPATLEALSPYREDLLVLSGLTHDKARPNGDGPGDHARSAACFLTGCQPRKTDGADIKVGVSVDQIAAEHLRNRTRFPSLEIGCDRGMNSGGCDSGYSCAYSANISWKSESMPMAKEIDPRQVFDRLFTDGPDSEANRTRRDESRQSILDFVLEDASGLSRQLGRQDLRKLDEYLESIREVERRIEAVRTRPIERPDGVERPAGVPDDYGEHIRLLCDLLALAFRSDATRVATFMLANEGSNRSYPFIEVPDGHHDLSHHGRDAEKQAKIARINRFHISHFAYLLEKLKSAPEGDSNLLENVMIVYGSGISDGNRHNHDDLPVLLAGHAGGRLKPGRHIEYADETPLANLYLSLLDRMDVPAEHLGDSTGRVDQLEG
jgi:hypothetical protein